MDPSTTSLTPSTEALLAQHGGPVTVPGQHGQYVVMRSDVYEAMLGLAVDEEADTLAAVHRGLADLVAGRVQDLDVAFDELEQLDGSER
jgi:hypothetical protein